MDEISVLASNLAQLNRTARNSERNPGPLKGVGYGDEFPNNPLSTYPTPAQDSGQTWWRFFHTGRNIDYYYDFTRDRWLSTQFHIAILQGDLSSITGAYSTIDRSMTISGTTDQLAIFNVYLVMTGVAGTYDVSNYIELRLQTSNIITGANIIWATYNTNNWAFGTNTKYAQTSPYWEVGTGMQLVFRARKVGTTASAVEGYAVIRYRTIG